MNRHLLAGLAIALLATGTYAASSKTTESDVANGERLHAADCKGCHDASVYTRPERKIRSLSALKGQLQNCAHMTSKEYSAAETQSLVTYLNERYYHFR